MTEKEAWLYLAQVWDLEPRMDTDMGGNPVPDAVFVRIAGDIACGLCVAIEAMYYEEMLSMGVWRDMREKIPSDGVAYLFPTTLEGAKERVRFCLERAGELL